MKDCLIYMVNISETCFYLFNQQKELHPEKAGFYAEDN